METLNSSAMLEALHAAGTALRNRMPGGMADQMGLHAVDCNPVAYMSLFESATPQPWMRNPMGWLHGGMVAAMLDSSMGIHCALYSGGAGTPTVNLNVNYLRPTPADRPLHIRTHIVKAGRSIVFAEATLWADDEQAPCASATAVFHLPARS